MCPTIWTNFGHILDTVWTFQITLGTCHEDVQKLSKSFGHFIPLWTLFGQVLDKFWTHYKVGHMLDTFWTCFGHLSTLWTHFGHFYVQNVSVPTSFTSPIGSSIYSECVIGRLKIGTRFSISRLFLSLLSKWTTAVRRPDGGREGGGRTRRTCKRTRMKNHARARSSHVISSELPPFPQTPSSASHSSRRFCIAWKLL